MVYEDDFARPADTGGEFVNPRQLDGHLLIVYPLGYVPFIQTKFSRPDKPSDGIAVDVVDLDDKDERGNPGKVYRNCNWMQGQLIASLKSRVGQKVLGRIGLGVARNGMNPPWVLVDMFDDAAARERASAWVRANPDFAPTVFTLREQQQSRPEPQQQGGYQQGGYQQPQQNYQPQQQQPQQRQPTYGVAGAPAPDAEEASLLEQLRRKRAQREAGGQDAYGQDPPF